MVETADIIWADGPAANPFEPDKSKIRAWGTWLETLVNAIGANAGTVYLTRDALNADLNRTENTMAWVVQDPTVAYNGIYRKSGASGSGSWSRVGDLPYSFIIATDTGAGTPDAIIGTTSIPISESSLIVLFLQNDTIGSPVTVKFNTGSPLRIKTRSNEDVEPGGLTAGPVIGLKEGTTFRLLNDEAIAALIYAARDDAEDARDDAAASAAIASGLASAFIIGENTFASRTAAMAWSPVAGPDYIRTAGYAAAGDKGGALYRKVGSEPSHPGKFSITLSGSGVVWYEIAEPILLPQMFGAIADGVADCAPAINAAIQVANARGGGIVHIPAGNHLVKSTVSMAGCSNITLQGGGWGSKIIASADLDGSVSETKNNIIGALNFSGPVTSTDGYPQKNLTVRDLYIDGTLQSASGVPAGQFAGFSLAGFEVLNVDFVRVFNCKFVKCFGNGLVFGTQNPRQLNGSFQNGLRGCVAENNVFEDCICGLLPQYATTTSPNGLAGSVIQAGSTYGCVIKNNLVTNPGGPFLNIFNSEEATVIGNTIKGQGITPVGSHPTADMSFQQPVGMLKSDFGLLNCTIADNHFINIGGILLLGNMGSGFFNDNIPTTGPVNCAIRGNRIISPPGNQSMPAFTVGASGATYTNPYSQSIRVLISGGTGVSVTYRRGTDGSFVAATLGPSGGITLLAGDAITVTYTTAPTSMGVLLSPNAVYSGITIVGGSVSGTSGVAMRNVIEGNVIVSPGQSCIRMVDSYHNIIRGNHLEAPGLTLSTAFIFITNALDQAGTGCIDNEFAGNHFIDQRSPIFARANIEEVRVGATARSFNNRFVSNRLELCTVAMTILTSQTNYFQGNFGPGWKSPVLASPAVPASGAELANPFAYDCFALVLGGTISAIAIGPAGATQTYGATGGLVPVRAGEVIKITYTVAPTVFNWFAS
ncbi:putative tail fiber protein [Rhizobium phage RHph_N28_2]|nr:putative tail fiber protein [Rhizobium phage RHph_N28_2]